MTRKIKVEFTEKQFMSVAQTVFHDINEMEEEKNDGVPQGTLLRNLKNANAAMMKGLQEWKENK
jgi:hypothetical protein